MNSLFLKVKALSRFCNSCDFPYCKRTTITNFFACCNFSVANRNSPGNWQAASQIAADLAQSTRNKPVTKWSIFIFFFIFWSLTLWVHCFINCILCSRTFFLIFIYASCLFYEHHGDVSLVPFNFWPRKCFSFSDFPHAAFHHHRLSGQARNVCCCWQHEFRVFLAWVRLLIALFT